MKTRELYKKYPLVTMVCAFVVIDLCALSFSERDLSVQVMSTSVAALCTTGVVYLLVPSVLKPRFCLGGGLSGKESLAKIVLGVVLSALVFGVVTFACASAGVGFVSDVVGEEDPAGLVELVSTPAGVLAQRVLLAFLLCAVTAVFEEGFFRGIVVPCAYEKSCHTIEEAQAQRAERESNASSTLPFEENPALSAALFSGILFGVIHVAGFAATTEGVPEATTTLATVFLAFQTLLKAVQAGMFGFCMAALLLKTRSLLLPILTHASFNLLYFMPSYLATGMVAATYITGNVGDMVALILSIALLLPPCVKSAYLMTHEVVTYNSFDE